MSYERALARRAREEKLLDAYHAWRASLTRAALFDPSEAARSEALRHTYEALREEWQLSVAGG